MKPKDECADCVARLNCPCRHIIPNLPDWAKAGGREYAGQEASVPYAGTGFGMAGVGTAGKCTTSGQIRTGMVMIDEDTRDAEESMGRLVQVD